MTLYMHNFDGNCCIAFYSFRAKDATYLFVCCIKFKYIYANYIFKYSSWKKIRITKSHAQWCHADIIIIKIIHFLIIMYSVLSWFHALHILSKSAISSWKNQQIDIQNHKSKRWKSFLYYTTSGSTWSSTGNARKWYWECCLAASC